MNIGSFEQLTTPIGCLQLKKCGSVSALTNFVVYALISSYAEDEVEAFYTDLKMFCREDHIFLNVIARDFNGKIGVGKKSEESHMWTHGLKWN
ncbi:unnamed protein product [Angiostrongylus costaricensis]|uniref:Craniofacial development protein 2-like n=1 Tax=Angiostrongylus costaricensis TaxID=334426 RepID=A0A0R3PN33_ANGCS|nr:unnamed protein product [Angiostrongylus costaricensis]